jgi:hypothetical protein
MLAAVIRVLQMVLRAAGRVAGLAAPNSRIGNGITHDDERPDRAAGPGPEAASARARHAGGDDPVPRSGGEPVAVADLRIAKKAPDVIAVPQSTAASDAAEPATTATLPPPPPARSPSGVTVTIIDAKTGAKREVVVSAPPPPTDPLPKKR